MPVTPRDILDVKPAEITALAEQVSQLISKDLAQYWDGQNPVLFSTGDRNRPDADTIALLKNPRVRRVLLDDWTRAGWNINFIISLSNAAQVTLSVNAKQ